ncbi:unnamed protein product [Rhizoctonia solani]|uniref:Transmembrane protein n=1 Tax=Rhizoctonia solani TaxID=456999 RepID=A0A8H3BGV9_9AGAM|nr:unnamed protein product [Rhizoctonia solani]
MSTSSGCIDSSSDWMFNAGQSPCQVLESVLKVCETNARVPNLSVDVSCASLGSADSACCCSTATYALVSACWVCQTNRSPDQLSSTYQSWWSECPVESRLNGSLPAIVSHMVVPRWALVQPNDSKWNMSSAQLAVSTPSHSPNKPPPYAAIAVCSVIALIFLLGMAAWLYRRRNRISPTRPSPDFEIDGGATSGLISNGRHPISPTSLAHLHSEPSRPSWAWWRPTAHKKRENDPGKIDAWRYPFDYEPVSTGSSGPGNGYYSSRRHLVPRSSADTLAMQNQSRNHTPIPGSTHNLATTPVQTYTAPPHGYVQPVSGAGYAPLNSSGYGSGYTQPPTYGQTVPYTYPYAQSAGSPLSPQYVSPTRTFGHVQSPNHIHSPTHMQPTHIQPPSHALQPIQPPLQGSSQQVVMIPVDQMSASQIEQLRSQFPDLRIKHKRRRRRRGEPETDHEGAGHDRGRTHHERGRTGTGHERTDQERRTGAGPDTRPRSWSVPAQVEWDGRPRNGVELREKYERRTSGVVVISVGAGGVKVREGGEGSRVREGSRGREESRARDESGRDERNSRVREQRERARARDAGVSLMGGPPTPILG